MKKRILFVMSQLYNGGAERSLVNLLNELPADRYDIDLLLFRPVGMFLKQVPKTVDILETPPELRYCYTPWKELHGVPLRRFVADGVSKVMTNDDDARRGYRWSHFYTHMIRDLPGHYDVAVAYLSGEQAAYVDEKVEADRKYVWVHNDYRSAGYSRKNDYPHFRNMDGIISISQHCVDVLKEVFPEFAGKIHLLENITSSTVVRQRADEFVPPEYREGVPSLLTVGRLDEQKGIDLAIRAAAIMKRHGVDFTWYVIGGGRYKEPELRKLISDLDVEDRFVLLGTKPNPYPYIKHCDVFVQPSRFEGKSVVLDEAKILAKPILVTNYPTARDQVHDGQEAVVVDLDPESIAEGLTGLLHDPERRRTLHEYLAAHEYGNAGIISEYCDLLDYGKIDGKDTDDE